MQLVVNRGKAQGKFINVTGPRFLIGRDPECQLRPASDEVSRRHAELAIIAGVPTLFDLGSEKGTRVNGQPLSGPVSLHNGDRIEIGPLCFTALLDEPEVKPTKRTRDDVIVEWLTEGDDEPAAVPRAPRRSPDASSVSERPGTPPGEDALDLLRAMTTRPS